jgi:hypothetical protein
MGRQKKKKNYASDCTYTSIRHHTYETTSNRETTKKGIKGGAENQEKGMSTITWLVIINDYIMRNV